MLRRASTTGVVSRRAASASTAYSRSSGAIRRAPARIVVASITRVPFVVMYFSGIVRIGQPV
jgi:hypothetical protein